MKHTSPYQRGVRDDMLRGFQGPTRGVVLLMFISILVLLALSTVCLILLVKADDTRSQILLGVFFLASLLSVGLLKMAYYQRLDRLTILDALEEIRDQRKD